MASLHEHKDWHAETHTHTHTHTKHMRLCTHVNMGEQIILNTQTCSRV